MNITDNQFKRITNQFDSENHVIRLFVKYHDLYGRGTLIDSLDSFAYHFGINFGVDLLTTKHPTPYFMFQEGNILNKPTGSSRWEDMKLKTYTDAQKFIVKELFKTMSFLDIKKHITTNKIQILQELL